MRTRSSNDASGAVGARKGGGVLVSVERGRTRLFSLNPRFPLARDLEAMLRRAVEYMPERERERYTARRRPRAPGKRL